MNRSSAPGFPGLPRHAERSRAPPFDLRAAAEELLGESWLHPLAFMLDINPRTLQRWAAGQNDAPEPIAARLGELLAIVRRCRADAAADRDRRAREQAAG